MPKQSGILWATSKNLISTPDNFKAVLDVTTLNNSGLYSKFSSFNLSINIARVNLDAKTGAVISFKIW